MTRSLTKLDVKQIKITPKKNVQLVNPDGIVSPLGNTILFLGGTRLSGKQIIIDLADQNLYAYEGNRLV